MRKVRLDKIVKLLERLGFDQRPGHSHILFRHPQTGVVVVLPLMRRSELLKQYHVAAIRHRLISSGLIGEEEFDDFIAKKGQ